MTLFKQAAAQDHAFSQRNIGIMYMKGQGVKQDRAQAKAWLDKACGNGDLQACLGSRLIDTP